MPHRARCPASPSIGLSGVCHHQSQEGNQPSLSAKSTTSGVRRRPKTSKAKDAGKKQSHFKYMATPIKKPLTWRGDISFRQKPEQSGDKTHPNQLTKRAAPATQLSVPPLCCQGFLWVRSSGLSGSGGSGILGSGFDGLLPPPINSVGVYHVII